MQLDSIVLRQSINGAMLPEPGAKTSICNNSTQQTSYVEAMSILCRNFQKICFYICYWFYLWFSDVGSNRWNWEINFLGQVLFPTHPLLQTWTRSTNKERQSAWKKYCSALFRKQAFVWTVVCAAKCFLRQKISRSALKEVEKIK